MADYIWPDDLVPFVQTFYLQPHVGGTESPFSRKRKAYGLSAPRWICRMAFRGGYSGIERQEGYGRRLDALLAQLQGGLHTVTAWDFRRSVRFHDDFEGWSDGTYFGDETGFARTTPISNEAVSAGDKTMTFTGLVEGEGFTVGDYIGGDGRPHIVTGVEGPTVAVEPPFSDDIAAGDATWRDVAGTFRLTSEDAGANPTEVGTAVQYEIELVEDL